MEAAEVNSGKWAMRRKDVINEVKGRVKSELKVGGCSVSGAIAAKVSTSDEDRGFA